MKFRYKPILGHCTCKLFKSVIRVLLLLKMTFHKTPYKLCSLFTVLVFCFVIFQSWWIYRFLFPVRTLQLPTDSISWEKNIQRSSTVGKNQKTFLFEKILSLLLSNVLWGVKFCTSFKKLIVIKERKLVHFIVVYVPRLLVV